MTVLGQARRNGRTETVGERTRLDILEATETLLALNGPGATSIRNIAARAEVNVAAVNYHFHSKDGLIDELLRRRATPLNQERLRRLDACLGVTVAAGGERVASLEDILQAFVAPMLHFAAAEPLPARALVAAQFLSRAAHRPGGFSSADTLHAKVEQRFLEGFATCLPTITPPVLVERFRFLEGALNLAMCGADEPPEVVPDDSADQKAARVGAMIETTANFIAFAAAGLRSRP